eukprot:g8346.t1
MTNEQEPYAPDSDDEMDTSGDEVDEIPVTLTPQEWKAKAGDLYKARDYRGAIAVYTEGIEACLKQKEEDEQEQEREEEEGGTAGEKHAFDAVAVAALYGNRAASYVMILGYEQAISDCDSALKLNPKFCNAIFRKAMALKKLGRFKESLSALQSGLLVDPNNAAQIKEKTDTEACVRKVERAAEMLAQQKPARAASTLEELLGKAPQSKELKLMKVECLMGMGKHEEAYAMSSALIRNSQNNSKLLITRARCLYLMGNLDSAVKHLQEAARQDPDSAEYRTLIKRFKLMESTKEAGNQAFKANNFQGAVKSWSEALAMDKNNKSFNSKLHCNLAAAYAKMSKHEEAVVEASRALSDDPTYTKAYERRAASLYDTGGVENLEAACRDYEKLMDMVPDEKQREIQGKLRKTQAALKQAKRKDYYKLLGVSRSADEAEIKKAYRKAALKYHPDRQSSKTEAEKEQAGKVFRDIGEAYEVLSDPTKKQRYDSGVDLEDLDNPHAGHGRRGHGGMEIDPSMLFQMFMQQGGGSMGGGRRGGGGGGMGGMGGMPFHFGRKQQVFELCEKVQRDLKLAGLPRHGCATDGTDYSSILAMWSSELGYVPSAASTERGAEKEAPKSEDTHGDSKKTPATAPTPAPPVNGDGPVRWYERAYDYWEDGQNCPPDDDGVLGGYGHISPTDISGSAAFLDELQSMRPLLGNTNAADCGAGIGRVTKHLLLNRFDTVDIVEQSPRLIQAAPKYVGRERDRTTCVCVGLQDFFPQADTYDVVWIQWVVGHFTDVDLIKLIGRCRSALRKDGLVVIKDNVVGEGEGAFKVDSADSSLTRSLGYFRSLFNHGGFKVVLQTQQEGFPGELFPVYMFALE